MPAPKCRGSGLSAIRFSAVAIGATDPETGTMPKHVDQQVVDSLTLPKGSNVSRERTPGRGHGHRWTREDDAFIQSHCESMTDTEMAVELGRSRVSVLMRRLKILQLRKKVNLPRWKPEDDDLLQELYGEVDTNFLAAVLSRPVATLRSRAYRLSIQNRGAWSCEEDDILRKHYPDLPVSEFAVLLPGRLVRSIYYRAQVLSLSRSSSYLLSSWLMRFHSYPPELKSLIRLHRQVERKLQHVQAQH